MNRQNLASYRISWLTVGLILSILTVIAIAVSWDTIAGLLKLSTSFVTDSCERMINEQQGLRIEGWHTYWGNYETRYFHTVDGGKSWVNVYEQSNDSSRPDINCAEVPLVEGRLLYISENDIMIIDGPEVRIVDINTLVKRRSCRYEVTFQDTKNAILAVECYSYPTPDSNVYETTQFTFTTSDAGKTWQPANETTE